MVKITPENVASKLGKRVDLKTTTELSLPNKQIDEIGSFSNFVNLEKVDLSGNWFKFTRHIEGLFAAPKLTEVNFTGCPVTKVANYRYFVIANCPLLQVLDNQPVTDEERDKALRLASGKEEKPVFDPLLNPNEDEEEKRKDALEAEKLRVQQEKKEREAERLKEKQVKEEQERIDRDQFLKLEGERLKKEKEVEEERSREEAEALAQREKEHQAKLEKEKKEKEAAKKAEEEKKKAEALKHAPIIEEKTIFKDDRTSMVITDRFSDFGLSDEPKKKKPEPKKSTLFDDDSLFGSTSNVTFKKDTFDLNLNEEDDVLKKLSAKTERKPVTAKIEESDLFSSSKPTSTSGLDDDLFSMVDNKSSKSALDSDDFNFDDYIAKQKAAAKSGGGLFD